MKMNEERNAKRKELSDEELKNVVGGLNWNRIKNSLRANVEPGVSPKVDEIISLIDSGHCREAEELIWSILYDSDDPFHTIVFECFLKMGR